MNLYVGNLAFTVTEEELRETFGPYGKLEKVEIITDKFSGQSKGFAFIDMPSNSEADTAIKALNGTPHNGRPIKVNQAQPPSKRRSGGGKRRH